MVKFLQNNVKISKSLVESLDSVTLYNPILPPEIDV